MSRSLERDIKDMLEGLVPPPTPDWPHFIYRVPKRLREINDAAYTPQAISIGPLHHGKGDLPKMEMHKCQYVSYFLERNRLSLEQLVSILKERETNIRNCYAAGPLEPDSDKFLKIILVDAIFIIEFFYRFCYGLLTGDHILSIMLKLDIIKDLILLENQLPFSLLEEIYELAFPPDSTNKYMSFLALAFAFFSYFNKQEKPITTSHNILHFTDLIRFFYLPSGHNISQNNVGSKLVEGRRYFLPRWFKEPEEISKTDNVPSAIELDQAGVTLKKKTGNCWLDINYKEGVLEIPRLELYDPIELIFRNMMALEQCHYPLKGRIICDYVVLLDVLVNMNKDVDLLVKKGIIYNCLGSSEAATELFNKFGINIVCGDSYYSNVPEGLIRYYKVPWHKWKATFKHDYFRTPWSTFSTIAAVILLVLTFIQTMCSILSVLRA